MMSSHEGVSRRKMLSGGLAAMGVFGLPRWVRGHEPFDLFAQAAPPKAHVPKAGTMLGHGKMKYRLLSDWGKLDPKKYPIVNCHAMVQTSDGLLHALCDGIRNNFLVYDAQGKLVRSWGTEYPGAHGLELVQEGGKEYFFVADGGWMVRNDQGRASREQGRISKITTDGKHLFTIGHPSTVGAYKPGQRFQPCDVASAPNGDFYVSDGYGSQWILQYDNNGKYIRKFGGPDDPNPAAKLSGAHGVSIDLRTPDKPMVVGSSRSANQLKWYTLDGKHVQTVDLPGAYGGQAVFAGDHAYVGVCWSKDKGTGKRLGQSGFVCILDKDNKVVSNPGGSEPVYKDGKLQPMYQTTKSFMHVHDVCVDKDQNIYVLQWNAKGAYPIKLERV